MRNVGRRRHVRVRRIRAAGSLNAGIAGSAHINHSDAVEAVMLAVERPSISAAASACQYRGLPGLISRFCPAGARGSSCYMCRGCSAISLPLVQSRLRWGRVGQIAGFSGAAGQGGRTCSLPGNAGYGRSGGRQRVRGRQAAGSRSATPGPMPPLKARPATGHARTSGTRRSRWRP
jgi:hypothetical protein